MPLIELPTYASETLFDLMPLVSELAPLPSANEALVSLHNVVERHAANLVKVTRAQLLAPSSSNPDEAIQALLDTSGWSKLERPDRFLAAKPDIWAKFSEPQITGGWCYYLSGQHSLERCQAAFTASWREKEQAPQLSVVEGVYAELGKIDLLILAKSSCDRRIALCVEAKFGHEITKGQLDDYERKLSKSHSVKDRSSRALLILAPNSRSDVREQQRKNSNEWDFRTWQQWLIDYENALPPEFDDNEFERFRNINLERARSEMDT